MSSGLYDSLVAEGLLIPHTETDIPAAAPEQAYKVIAPERVAFISYPYEWSFSQLKDAALLTLRIQKLALEKGMVLKDASAYNIQFLRGKPVLIDTLSFAKYVEGTTWVAYRQFCQHFLAPLALMSQVDVRLSQLMRLHIDGIPLDLASRLLPGKTRFNLSLLTHLHAHAYAQSATANRPSAAVPARTASFSRIAFIGLIDSLTNAVRKLSWKPAGGWAGYYDDTNYSGDAFDTKKQLVSSLIHEFRPALLWDLGANTGLFSRLASGLEDTLVVSADFDPAAVEINYKECSSDDLTNILPLVIDLTNPPAAIGWANNERQSFSERGPADMVLALALIHHLAISNNVPLVDIARFFASVSRRLVIEFVPKEDSQVQRLLASRDDIFTEYSIEGFKQAFSEYFEIDRQIPIDGTARTLFLLTAK